MSTTCVLLSVKLNTYKILFYHKITVLKHINRTITNKSIICLIHEIHHHLLQYNMIWMMLTKGDMTSSEIHKTKPVNIKRKENPSPSAIYKDQPLESSILWFSKKFMFLYYFSHDHFLHVTHP